MKSERDILLSKLNELDTKTLALAVAYAQNLEMYGVNVAEKWETACSQVANLHRARMAGYYDGLKLRSTPCVWLKVDDEEPVAYDCSGCGAMVSKKTRFCPGCGARMEVEDDERGI